jgi:hypothetical protein
MIDLDLLHPANAPANADWRMVNRLNGWTRRIPCRLLEWSGWYNYNVAQRLLGHYRLFQHFKAANKTLPHDLPLTRAYILQYQGSHGVKYFISRLTSFIFSTFTKEYYPVVEIAAVNRRLLTGRSDVLENFLANVDLDFKNALLRALDQINQQSFFNTVPAQPPKTEEHYHAHQYNTVSYNQFNFQSTTTQGPRGKEAGLFSKKQILICFDLLSKSKDFDPIDYGKPNKFDRYAGLLHALTGRTKESLLEELHKYHNRGLYEWHTDGERDQLISTLTNLAETFGNAGFHTFAKLADKKIRDIKGRPPI